MSSSNSILFARPKKRTVSLILALGLVVQPVAAQEQKPQELSKPFVKSVEVSLTNLEVVVVDSKGHRVPELTKDDFEVRENGDVQPLTNFFAIENGEVVSSNFESEAAPAPEPGANRPSLPVAPKSHVVIFLDNVHLTPQSRTPILAKLDEFLPTAVGPSAEAMLATWNESLSFPQNFTSDARRIQEAVREVAGRTALGTNMFAERSVLFHQIDEAVNADANTRGLLIDSAMRGVDAFVERRTAEVQTTLKALRVVTSELAGLEGRKMLLYVSENLPKNPGIEIWDYFRDALMQSGMVTLANNLPNGLREDQTHYYREFVEAANAAGVTVYTLDGSGLSPSASLGPENRFRFDGTIAQVGTTAIMQMMADETGGAALTNQYDLGPAFLDLKADWSSYYSLGYQTPKPGSKRPRHIDVRVKQKGLTVRFRHSLVERSAEARITDAVYSGLFFAQRSNPLGMQIEVGKLVRSKKDYLVGLTFRVPYEKITLIPEKNQARGRLVFYVAVKDEKGRISSIQTQQVPVDLPSMPKNGEFLYETKLKVRVGRQVASLALVDEPTKTASFVQQEFNIAERGPGR